MTSKRKSRRARLPTSVIRAGVDWSPAEDDWRRIERACPFLKPEDRFALQAIMIDAVNWSPFELAAPFVDDAQEFLNRLERAATDFWHATHVSSLRDEKRDAASYVESLVEEHLTKAERWRDSSWTHVVLAMTDIVEAIGRAKDDLKAAPNGFAENDAWEEMVYALSEFAHSRHYPTAAPKGTDKAQNPSTPAFVVLVKEVQRSFPENCRRPITVTLRWRRRLRSRDANAGGSLNPNGRRFNLPPLI